MKFSPPIPAKFMLILWGILTSTAAHAHSNEVVEAALKAKESYVKFIRQEAPPFRLEDVSGEHWELYILATIHLWLPENQSGADTCDGRT